MSDDGRPRPPLEAAAPRKVTEVMRPTGAPAATGRADPYGTTGPAQRATTSAAQRATTSPVQRATAGAAQRAGTGAAKRNTAPLRQNTTSPARPKRATRANRPVTGTAAAAATPPPPAPLADQGAPDLSGRVLGNWRLQRRLGAGSFGVVYEAQNAAISARLAAVKVLHPHLSVQPEIKRRFINEASAASRAEHANIVQVYDGGITDDNICYVVMELLKGQTLRELLDRGRLEPIRAIRVARQVTRALGAAHREGIVHRDLKPDNIFLAQRSEDPEFVKVLDFGIAKLAADAAGNGEMFQTRTGMWLGTPAYMSPEQWQTLPDIDRRADIYALGVILHEALTGQPPFSGATQFMVMMAHLNDAPPVARDLNPAIPTSLSRLLGRMMAKPREERPQTMGEVESALQDIDEELRPPGGGSINEERDPLEGDTARGLAPVPRGDEFTLTPGQRRPSYPPIVDGAFRSGALNRARTRPPLGADGGPTPDELRKSLERDPYRIEPYRALHRVFVDRVDLDAAWCTASVLTFLQRATPEEAAFFERFRSARVPAPEASLRDEAWEKLLMHPEEDPTVGAMLAAICQPAALLRASTMRQFGLKRQSRVDPASHGSAFARVFSVAARVLQPIVPEVYHRADQRGGIKIANCRDGNLLQPALLVGNDVLSDGRNDELAFRVGRLLTLFRPERYLKLIYPSMVDLRTVFLGGLKLAQPVVTGSATEAQQIAQYAQRLAPSVAGPVRQLLAKAALGLPRDPVEVYLTRWSQAVELTAHRVGLLLCNDVAVAARLVEGEPAQASGLQTDKVGELLRFAVSESYLALRRQLGIAVA